MTIPEQGGDGPFEDQIPAQMSRTRSNIHYVIRRQDEIGLVFHHHHRIAQIPQFVQQLNQAEAIPLMQTNAGFVQDIQGADQAAPQGGGQFDSLRLPAR